MPCPCGYTAITFGFRDATAPAFAATTSCSLAGKARAPGLRCVTARNPAWVPGSTDLDMVTSELTSLRLGSAADPSTSDCVVSSASNPSVLALGSTIVTVDVSASAPGQPDCARPASPLAWPGDAASTSGDVAIAG